MTQTVSRAAIDASVGMDASDFRWAIGLSLFFLAVGLIFVRLVPPGLPYDEPSHFNIVQLHSQGNDLPVPGRDGATYEAAQPPLYYFLAGLAYRAISGILSPAEAFYGCRVLTLLAACPLVYLTYQLAREFSGRTDVARCAAVLVAVNPSILAIASSVQNDSLAFLLATLASLWCIGWSWQRKLTAGRMTALSLIVAAAILTKSSTLALIPLVFILLIAVYRKEAAWRLAIFGLVLAVTTGWWFFRNHQVYGDWSGASSVAGVFGTGGDDSRFNPRSPHDWAWAARSFVTGYTVPVTYWRSEVKNPRWLSGAIGLGISCILLGMIPAALHRRLSGKWMTSAALFVLLGVGLWLYISYKNFGVSSRVSMPAMASLLLLCSASLCEVRDSFLRLPAARRFALPILTIVLLAGDAHLLAKASHLSHRPYEIRLGSD